MGAGQLARMAGEAAHPGGVCRVVSGQKVAEIAGAVGVMAIEVFWSVGRFLVDEVTTRPHNSGHWTIEGAVTSRYEKDWSAVLDLPLGWGAPQHPQVAGVDIFGGPPGEDPGVLLTCGLAMEGAHAHPYGIGATSGRKLGDMTVCGDDPEVVRERVWAAARALGTPRPDGLRRPAGVPS